MSEMKKIKRKREAKKNLFYVLKIRKMNSFEILENKLKTSIIAIYFIHNGKKKILQFYWSKFI